ncbi:MAG: hypothetical protein NAG76_14075 [Candidatus Pristimantibacillus lignocellulolyticus]|uniref:Uncharacterized protein n=1 Tax=Candidatus Pristimantibacillus lignocellulolyticus TaxID=2994561 RepID=A0A9J6ZAJ6_9BACL|nr:MAG: hypothetical protein NAG76_14075 [Candidatus Pristimantibacillus lignocellulolyticus]
MRFSIKVLLSILLVAIVTLVIGIIFIKNNSPLDAAYFASTYDKDVILVGVGNKGRFADIMVEDVFVNNNSQPLSVKIQVSDSFTGFIVSSNFEGDEEKKYNFQDLNSVSIPANTGRQEHFDKLSNGTASEKDPIYAITIKHDESIQKIRINYRYLGFAYEKIIEIQ